MGVISTKVARYKCDNDADDKRSSQTVRLRDLLQSDWRVILASRIIAGHVGGARLGSHPPPPDSMVKAAA